MSVCVVFMCLQRIENSKVVSDWLILDVYRSIHDGSPLQTQFVDVVVLVVVFFALLSRRRPQPGILMLTLKREDI